MDDLQSNIHPNFKTIITLSVISQVPLALVLRRLQHKSFARLVNLSATFFWIILFLKPLLSSISVLLLVILVNFTLWHLLYVIRPKPQPISVAYCILFANLAAYCSYSLWVSGSFFVISDSFVLYIWAFVIQRVTHVIFLTHDRSLKRFSYPIVSQRPLSNHIQHPYPFTYIEIWHNFIDYICYCLGYIGIIVGPYFDLENYLKIFHNDEKTSKINDDDNNQVKISFYGVKFDEKCFDDSMFHSMTLLFVILMYIITNILKENPNYIIKSIDKNFYVLPFLDFHLSIMIVHSITYISLAILNYDQSMFLYPSKSDKSKMPNSIRLSFLNTSLRDQINDWNRSVVMWLNMMFRPYLSSKYLMICCFITSMAWHGFTYNYCITTIVALLLLTINKNHHKLLTRKRQLSWIKNCRDTQCYTFISWILTLISSCIIAMTMQRLTFEELNRNLIRSIIGYASLAIISMQYLMNVLLS